MPTSNSSTLTATVLMSGHPQKVQLAPAEGNELVGELSAALSGNTVATVSLKVAGQSATARFASTG